MSRDLVAGRKVMSVDRNLLLSNSQASLLRCHSLGCIVGCSAQPYFKTSFEPTYVGVEPKDKTLALVVSEAFPRNCFWAPRQKRAPPCADIGDTWADQAAWWYSAL